MFSEKIFSGRLKELRKSQNLTLQQLGEKIGATKATIGNLENCNKQPSLTMIEKLAEFFGVSVDYLLGFSDNAKLSAQEKALLDLFNKMDVVKQAQLLVFAAELAN